MFYVLLLMGILAATLYYTPAFVGSDVVPNGGNSIYGADVPLPDTPPRLIDGLILLRAQDMVNAPIVDGFQWPCGGQSASMVYDAQPFGSFNSKRAGYHTGCDINGIGGQNSDFDMPVYAAARGLVVYSGVPDKSWGNVVVLAHRLPDSGAIVQTLYAHLHKREVHVGQHIGRGRRLGTVGTAGGIYWAHLHFEAIPSLCTEAGMPGYHPQGTMNRIDPAQLIHRYPAPPIPDPYSEVRRLRAEEAAREDSIRPLPPDSLPKPAS